MIQVQCAKDTADIQEDRRKKMKLPRGMKSEALTLADGRPRAQDAVREDSGRDGAGGGLACPHE